MKKVRGLSKAMQISVVKTDLYKTKSKSLYGKCFNKKRISSIKFYSHDIIEYKIENVINEHEMRNPVNSINLYEKKILLQSNKRYESSEDLHNVSYFQNILKTLSNINLLLEKKDINNSNEVTAELGTTVVVNESKKTDDKWDEISKLVVNKKEPEFNEDNGDNEENEENEESEESSIDENLKDLLMNYNKELLKIRNIDTKVIPDNLSDESL
jgi:hypothetical protein